MKIAGIQLPESIQLNKKPLHLNGAAIRSKFFIQTYVIALYAAQPITSESEGIDSNIERSLRMYITTPLATSKVVSESIQSGMKDSLGELYKKQHDLIEDLRMVIEQSGVQYKDNIDIYVTAKGELKLFKNEEEIYHNKDGRLFAQSIYSMYLGKRPKDNQIKKALLKGF